MDPDQPLTTQMCQELIEIYSIKKDKEYGEYQTFLGKIIDQGKGNIIHEEGSRTVSNYMDSVAKEELTQANKIRSAEEGRITEINKAKYDNSLKDFNERYKVWEEEDRNEIRQRIENPYFNEVKGDLGKESYEGINLSNGKIMRLRDVNKIAKEDGTYLYTAFRTDTKGETDARLDDYMGYPIIFETDYRLEDIPRMYNEEVVRQILTLLGTDFNELNMQRLTYIGKASRDGEITRNKKSDSKFIQGKIEEMQEYFKQKLSRDDEGR